MNIERVKELIERGYETECIDFKERFHENKAELMHDILCLANNTEFQDAYIVFGINDKRETVGVENHQKRVKLADIQGLLHDNRPKFFNNEVPKVDVVELWDSGHEIDVLEIKSTFNVPYFLIEQYPDGKKTVRSGHIYSRSGDRNTPIDEYASPNQTEILWKKRNFLLEKPITYLLHLLDNPTNWVKEEASDFQTETYYYEFAPEYTILDSFQSDNENIDRNYYLSFAQTNRTTMFGKYKCLHNTTCLISGTLITLDGGRTTVPNPRFKSFGAYGETSFLVDYYLLNSINYKLLRLFNPVHHDWYNVGLHKFFEHTLVFTGVDELDRFFMYIEENVPTYYHIIQEYVSDNYFDPEASQSDMERLATGYILKKELEDFRNIH